MTEIVHKEESFQIIGACFEVYKLKGCGFAESVYQECLKIEFELQSIPYVSQPKLELEHKGRLLNGTFQPDFICFGKIIVELKSVGKIVDEHRAQTINYLNATNFDLALLVNFGHHPKLEYERLANTKNKTSVVEEIKKWVD